MAKRAAHWNEKNTEYCVSNTHNKWLIKVRAYVCTLYGIHKCVFELVRQCLKSNVDVTLVCVFVNLKRRKKNVKKKLVVGNRVFCLPTFTYELYWTEFSLGLLSACLKFIDVFSHTHSQFDSKKKLNMDKSLNVRICFFFLVSLDSNEAFISFANRSTWIRDRRYAAQNKNQTHHIILSWKKNIILMINERFIWSKGKRDFNLMQ